MLDISYRNDYDNFLNKNTLSSNLSITSINANAGINSGSIGLDNTTIGTLVAGEDVKSKNFVSGTSGWRIEGNGDVEFGSGTFRGSITGSTINIPDATTPLFSVDSSGNVKVKSLARDDIHYFSIFESVDGYSTSVQAGGSITATSGGVNLTTDSNTDDWCYILKDLGSLMSWDKNRKFKCEVKLTSVTEQEAYIITGATPSFPSIARHFGFYIHDNTIYSTIADGTTEYKQSLTTFLANDIIVLEASLDVDTGYIKFYINETLEYTSDGTGTPTSSSSAGRPLTIRFATTENVAKTMTNNWVDFWQANT